VNESWELGKAPITTSPTVNVFLFFVSHIHFNLNIRLNLLFFNTSTDKSTNQHIQSSKMRLIIREDPTQASSYIAKYIIGEPYSIPHIPAPKPNISPSRQNQSFQPNQRTALRSRPPNRFLPSRHLQDPRRKIQSRRNFIRKCRYFQHGMSFTPTLSLVPQPYHAIQSKFHRSADTVKTGRIHRHPPRPPRILPHIHVHALLLPRKRAPLQHPHPKRQRPRPRS
jgi:hypothetical protein